MPSVNDLAKRFYQIATGWNDGVATAPAASGIPVNVTAFEANSLGASGATSADHTAGMVVTSIAAPPAGLYKVYLQVASAGGAVVANDMKNYEFRVGATPLVKPLAALADSIGILEAQVRFDGSTGCSVNCTGAGTANVRVAASITLTKVAN